NSSFVIGIIADNQIMNLTYNTVVLKKGCQRINSKYYSRCIVELATSVSATTDNLLHKDRKK
ncbi:MAG: hypothetical protein PHC38_09780, partial [Weeksellaceae bacterium]|nr:hypothetical protein [Weeksellaceae bacterium]